MRTRVATNANNRHSRTTCNHANNPPLCKQTTIAQYTTSSWMQAHLWILSMRAYDSPSHFTQCRLEVGVTHGHSWSRWSAHCEQFGCGPKAPTQARQCRTVACCTTGDQKFQVALEDYPNMRRRHAFQLCAQSEQCGSILCWNWLRCT